MSELTLQELYDYKASAKSKLILGIVLEAIAWVLYFIGIITMYFYIGFLFLFACIICSLIATPLIIIGIVKMIIATTKINRLKNAANQ